MYTVCSLTILFLGISASSLQVQRSSDPLGSTYSSTNRNSTSKGDLGLDLEQMSKMIQEKVNATAYSLVPAAVITRQGTGTTTPGTLSGLATTIGVVGTALVLIKGGMTFLLSVVKMFLVPAIVSVFLLAIVVGGAVFFLCAITDCQGRLGSTLGGTSTKDDGGAGEGGATMIDNRNTVTILQELMAVIEGIDRGYRNFEDNVKGH